MEGGVVALLNLTIIIRIRYIKASVHSGAFSHMEQTWAGQHLKD